MAASQPDTSLFLVDLNQDSASLLAAIEQSLHHATSPPASLPNLTNVVLGDPYLAQQLTDLHRQWEIRPQRAQGLVARLRTRLAWWLLGPELQQTNQVHATLVRLTDSLIVQLDQERAARRRVEEYLAMLDKTVEN
jgi:hypothetical protein